MVWGGAGGALALSHFSRKKTKNKIGVRLYRFYTNPQRYQLKMTDLTPSERKAEEGETTELTSEKFPTALASQPTDRSAKKRVTLTSTAYGKENSKVIVHLDASGIGTTTTVGTGTGTGTATTPVTTIIEEEEEQQQQGQEEEEKGEDARASTTILAPVASNSPNAPGNVGGNSKGDEKQLRTFI